MDTNNTFYKGIRSNTDPLKREGAVWDFPSAGIRIVNRKGQGFIITNDHRNEYEFSVSDGFAPIAACESDGIAYILSMQSNLGLSDPLCEIGCFPSPLNWSDTNTEFERVYKPLMNYNHGPFPNIWTKMRTSLFNWSFETDTFVVSKKSYDNSIDLIITDYINPVRIVNTGFKITGELTDRVHNVRDFDGKFNLILYSKKFPELTSFTIEQGGNLQPGNYFIFLRYMTDDFNRTHFVENFGPFQIGEGTTANKIQGAQDKNWLKDTTNYVRKKIRLQLTNLNTAYQFFELGIMRMSAQNENGTAKPDTYLLVNQYAIDGMTKEVLITGEETTEALTYEELISTRFPYSINRTHVIWEKRYVGENWKRKHTAFDNVAFLAFAQSITLSDDYSDDLFGEDGAFAHEESYADINSFKNPQNTYKFAGYFRDQMYPYGIVGIFDDGTETPAFPVTGNINGVPNEKGIYKFRSWMNAHDKSRTLGIVFNMGNANTYWQAHQSSFNGLIGFKFVRGPRFDNLKYQGIVFPTYNGIGRYYDENVVLLWKRGIHDPNGYDENTAYSVPLFNGALPMTWFVPIEYSNDEDKWFYRKSLYDNNFYGEPLGVYRTLLSTGKYAIFSPDLLFEPESPSLDEAYIQEVYGMTPYYNPDSGGSIFTLDESEGVLPRWIGFDQRLDDVNLNYTITASDNCVRMDTAIIDKMTKKGSLRFSSYMPSKSISFEDAQHQRKEYSRTMAFSRYIGVNDEDDFLATKHYHIVNVYENDNDTVFFDSIIDSYQVYNSKYYSISKLIKFYDNTPTHLIFRGDCFLQKTFFRMVRWYGYIDAGIFEIDWRPGDGGLYLDNTDEHNYYQHGFFIGIVTECKFNTSMRNEVPAINEFNEEIKYSFIPVSISDFGDLKQWVVYKDVAQHEAFQINDGYNKIVPEKIYFGYNENKPMSDESYKRNRIYSSPPNISGSFVDMFRNIGTLSFQDFPSEYGDAMRLISDKDFLITVNENGIFQHYVDEKVIQNDDSGSSGLIFRSNTQWLSDKVKIIAEFGTQHPASVVKSELAVFGFDWRKKVLWRCNQKEGQGGRFRMSAEDLGVSKDIQNWIDELFSNYSEFTDASEQMPNLPLLGIGIVSGVDKGNKEVLTSFMFKDSDNQRHDVTLYFSEFIDAFTGALEDTVSALYFSINNDLYSVGMVHYNSLNDIMVSSDIYYHNNGLFQVLYGIKRPFLFTFVVNALNEKNDFSDFIKLFESMDIDMNYVKLTRITFETETQKKVYDFSELGDNPRFWENSEYGENRWHVPISLTEQELPKTFYKYLSEMRGKWVKITLEYMPEEDAEQIILRSVKTEFSISFD